MKKYDEILIEDSTLNKARDDEMIFILRGQDMSSPKIIMEWIQANMHHLPDAKLREAFECALKMRQTPNRKSPD